MPQIEMHIPKGAITREAKAELVTKMTRLLLKMEGAPENEYSLALTWCFVREYEPNDFAVAGQPLTQPHYRIVMTAPQGTLGLHGPSMLRNRNALVSRATALMLVAEGSEMNIVNAGRVWVQIIEIPNGFWGGYGEIVDIMDVASFVGNERAKPPTERGLRSRAAFEARTQTAQ